MNDLIFETMLAEASFKIAEKTITGIDLDEAIHEVSNEMELDKREVEALRERTKKSPSVKKSTLVDEEESPEQDSQEPLDDPEDLDTNTITFSSEDELSTAVGVLMYKGIPWVSKSQDSVTFMNIQDVKLAQDALARRWDFISGDPRTVASIAFDNLADYAKVLDFIASKKMGVIMRGEDLEPDQDLELAEAEAQFKRDSKNNREAGLPSPEMPSQDMSFKALHKDSLVDVGALDVLSDAKSRAVHVVKRWK